MLLLVITLLLAGAVQSADFGGNNIFQTRSILENYLPPEEGKIRNLNQSSGFYSARVGGECYNTPDSISKEAVFRSQQDNNFLEMVNFLEFVQTTSTSSGGAAREDAIRYYNVSTAAMDAGNTVVAQENIARAMGAIESYSRRRKRDETALWNAADLFDEFRERMGEDKLAELLHLNKKVTMAFVIDTSSSMANDMGHVRQYIEQLINEQVNAGVDAVYVVTTFADPSSSSARTTKAFKSKQSLFNHLDRLETRIGGDCEERTCYGMLQALYNNQFMKVKNAAMYVFTDAGSKDCKMQATTIVRILQYIKASAFFILFDSCKSTIDSNYVEISQKTGGFCLLVRDNGVYNITDTVNGAFENDALICGEHSDNSNSVVGQGDAFYRNKRSDGVPMNRGRNPLIVQREEEKSILIDTSIEKFKVIVTIIPASLLSEVRLEKPANGDSELCDGILSNGKPNIIVNTSTADNTVIFDVSAQNCPCTGYWKVKYPEEAESFSYSVKSTGEYLVTFDSYFVDEIDTTRVANYAPCLGIEEYLVIKLNQGEKVNTDTLSAKIVGVAGNVVHWEGELAADKAYTNTYIVRLVIPMDMGTEGFRITLEGEIVDGTRFQRISSSYFYPTGSCLRLVDITNYYSLFPKRKTYIDVEISNNNEVEELYSLVCSNTENYAVAIGGPSVTTPGSKKKVHARSNPVLLKSLQKAIYTVAIQAPKKLVRGRTVTVNCRVTTSTDELLDIIRLTEMEEQFRD